MIDISIKVSNDHASMTEKFETSHLILDTEDEHLKSMIQKVIKSFNQEVDEVIVKTRMEV